MIVIRIRRFGSSGPRGGDYNGLQWNRILRIFHRRAGRRGIIHGVAAGAVRPGSHGIERDLRMSEPIGKTILSDLRQGDLLHTLRRDLKDIYDFYLDRDTRDRLSRMGRVKRWFHMAWWLIKSMFYKLTSVRRLMVVLAVIIAFSSGQVAFNGEHFSWHSDFKGIGFLILLVVLALELKDKLLAHDELLVGRKVQAALMPLDNPVFEGWDVWLFTRSANEVSGDLVDYLRLSQNRLGVALGDVAGKGLGAALCMARVQATLHAIAAEFRSLAQLMTRMNRIVLRDGLPTRFSTLVYAEIRPTSDEVRLVNAGHYPPILVRSGAAAVMKQGAPALGITAKASFREQTVRLKKGESLLIYSDGITDARNAHGTHFDEKRLMDLMPSLKGLPAADMGKAVLAAVDRFVGEARQNDDLSLVILQRKD
jgi:hypothetical protein